MSLSTGLHATVELVVGEDDTAIAARSGDVAVLATPRIVALCEEAAVAAVVGALDPESTTVGFRVQIEHLAPAPVGRAVTAEASLERIEGRRLVFKVSAKDERGLVAAGRLTRVLVDRKRFLEGTR